MPGEFFLRVMAAAVLVAVTAGPLGSIVLWRRMVYFGDTISHASLLGVALALALNLPVLTGVLIVAVAVAGVLLFAGGRIHHADTILGISAHGALALGLVGVSFLSGVKVDLMSYLIGDILAVTWTDVALIAGGLVICLTLVVWRWRPLLISTLDREIALAEGRNPSFDSAIFTLALAVLVAVAIKVVGALLITALLIIPAATARLGAATPEKMALLAAVCGAAAALAGLVGSFAWNTPTGPSIVVAALILLLVASAAKSLVSRLAKKD